MDDTFYLGCSVARPITAQNDDDFDLKVGETYEYRLETSGFDAEMNWFNTERGRGTITLSRMESDPDSWEEWWREGNYAERYD